MMILSPYRFAQGQPVESDPYWSNVRSLLPLDESVTADAAGSPPTWARVGQGNIQVGVKLFDRPTYQLDGSSFAYSSLQGSDLGSGDFTLEFWFYPTREGTSTSDYQRIISVESGSSNMLLIRYEYKSIQVVYEASSASGFINTGVIPSLNSWHHLVFQRRSGQIELYIDGQQIANQPYVGSGFPQTPISLGGRYQDDSSKEYFSGFLSNFRVTVGVARYSGSFAVPTKPFPRQ